jgi:hypothetical protein
LTFKSGQLLHPVPKATPYELSSALGLQKDEKLFHLHMQISTLQESFALQ